MRYIRKRGQPKKFENWKRKAAGEPDGATFPIRDVKARDAVVDQMRSEQGGLCAYTMWPLDDHIRTCIEHIYCRDRHPERALDFSNMVLCAKGTLKKEFGFGESQKGNLIVTDQNFVSPLTRNCESRFTFKNDGSMVAAKAGDDAADKTIRTLNLNDNALQAARGRAIQVQFIGVGKIKPVSVAKAKELAEAITNARFGDPLPAFAIAIKQSALRFVKLHEKRAIRLAARQSR